MGGGLGRVSSSRYMDGGWGAREGELLQVHGWRGGKGYHDLKEKEATK